MKKRFLKRQLALAAVFVMIAALLFPSDAYAAPVILGLSSQDISVGDSFSVYISGSTSSNLSLHYDGTMVKLTGQGNASLDGNTLSITAKSASFTFEALKEGKAGFVASSDAYEKSSVNVNIAAASNTESTDQDTKETDATETDTSEGKEDEDKATDESSDTKAESQETEAAQETDTISASSDEAQLSTEDAETSDSISSSDLSFKQLILDRRMILVIAILAAIIIALIIRLCMIHFSDNDDDYESDDLDFDEEEEKIKEKEKIQEKAKDDKKESMESLKKVIESDPAIDEEKLSMPKAPKKPNEKLKIDDLNDL